jgi:IS5 family transposase
MKVRFRPTTGDSFWGRFAYEHVVSPDHYLVKLRDLIDWDRFTPRFVSLYAGEGKRGPMAYQPVIVFKMLLLAYHYNLSERDVERYCVENIPARLFLDVSLADPIPDHSTLCLFRSRIEAVPDPTKNNTRKGMRNHLEEQYRALFEEMLQQAMGLGIKLGSIQVVDSVHTVANVNNEKDRIRQEAGKDSVDPDASVVHKGTREVTAPDGKVAPQEVMFRGYKTHVSMDAESRLVTALLTTPGAESDCLQFEELLKLDEKQKVPGKTYAGDRGYDSSELHHLLQKEKHKGDALKLRSTRTTKKDPTRQVWIELKQTEAYQEGQRQRYAIEAKFGESKAWHGFGRCRYRGMLRYVAQSFLTFMALNMKRIIYLVTGVPFRGEPQLRLRPAAA